jgi:hypothetical protein
MLIELKLNQSHLIDDKENLLEEKADTLGNLEQLQNQVAMMMES